MPRNPVADLPCEQVHVGATIPPDAVEFGRAMETWQRANGRYATWRDVLRVAKSLGYERQPVRKDGEEMEPPKCAFVKDSRCPKCGAALLTSGISVLCSFVGRAGVPACDYGIRERVPADAAQQTPGAAGGG
jgi:hypothetical protein